MDEVAKRVHVAIAYERGCLESGLEPDLGVQATLEAWIQDRRTPQPTVGPPNRENASARRHVVEATLRAARASGIRVSLIVAAVLVAWSVPDPER